MVILEGRPEQGNRISKEGRIYSCSHLRSPEMKKLVTGSEIVIARSGYTSIMELISMQCSALLIPTPGQTEQEYLADYLSAKGWFGKMRQKDLKSEAALSAPELPELHSIMIDSKKLLDSVLDEILKEV